MKKSEMAVFDTPLTNQSLKQRLSQSTTLDQLRMKSVRPPFKTTSTSKELFGNDDRRERGRIRKRPTQLDKKKPQQWGESASIWGVGRMEVERTVRWYEGSRSLWAALVIDVFQDRPVLQGLGFPGDYDSEEGEMSGSRHFQALGKVGHRRRKDVAAFLETLVWMVEGKISEAEFTVLYTAWHAHCHGQSLVPSKSASGYCSTPESQEKMPKSPPKEEHNEQEALMTADLPWFRQHLWAQGYDTKVVDIMLAAVLRESQRALMRALRFLPGLSIPQNSEHWMHLALTLFFQLDAHGHGALTLNELLHLVVANRIAETSSGMSFSESGFNSGGTRNMNISSFSMVFTAEDLYLQASVLTFEMATGRFCADSDRDLKMGETRAGLVTLPAWMAYLQRQVVTEDVLEAYIQVLQLVLFLYAPGEEEKCESQEVESADTWGQAVREVVGRSTLFKEEFQQSTACPTRSGAFFLIDAKPLLANLSGIEAVSALLLSSYKDQVGGLLTDDHIESMELLIQRLIARFCEKIENMTVKIEGLDSVNDIHIPKSVLLTPRCMPASKNATLFEHMKWTYEGPDVPFSSYVNRNMQRTVSELSINIDGSRRSRKPWNYNDSDSDSYQMPLNNLRGKYEDLSEQTDVAGAGRISESTRTGQLQRRHRQSLVVTLGQGENLPKDKRAYQFTAQMALSASSPRVSPRVAWANKKQLSPPKLTGGKGMGSTQLSDTESVSQGQSEDQAVSPSEFPKKPHRSSVDTSPSRKKVVSSQQLRRNTMISPSSNPRTSDNDTESTNSKEMESSQSLFAYLKTEVSAKSDGKPSPQAQDMELPISEDLRIDSIPEVHDEDIDRSNYDFGNTEKVQGKNTRHKELEKKKKKKRKKKTTAIEEQMRLLSELEAKHRDSIGISLPIFVPAKGALTHNAEDFWEGASSSSEYNTSEVDGTQSVGSIGESISGGPAQIDVNRGTLNWAQSPFDLQISDEEEQPGDHACGPFFRNSEDLHSPEI